jgi:mannose-6-phosphate isomerase-like protein (cupin superfamily)
MDIDAMEGFAPPEDFGDTIIPFTFHFWTKGAPEIVPFSPEMTRRTHGTNAGVFYYQPGLRSGWFDVRPGEHVNENEKSRDNPFPSMFIMLEGELTAIVGGVETAFKAGNMMFVPAGVSHEFINNTGKPAFGFLFMFGDGA